MFRLTASLGLAALAAGCAGLHAPTSTEPAVQHRVAEDDQVRIDELRVRGQNQRVAVQPKGGARGYEIVQPPGGQDPSARRDAQGATGQRVWLWTF